MNVADVGGPTKQAGDAIQPVTRGPGAIGALVPLPFPNPTIAVVWLGFVIE